MRRLAIILAPIAVLAVSTAPVASAGPSKQEAATATVKSFSIDIGTSEKLRLKPTVSHPATGERLEGMSKQGAVLYNGHAGLGVNASGGWDPTLDAAQPRGAHVNASVNVKST